MYRSDESSAPTLQALLAAAAQSADWDHEVIHRCAWCSRVADADNVYRPSGAARLLRAVTDGICPDCWVEAMQRVAARAPRQVAMAAA